MGNCPLCNNEAEINETGPLGDIANYNCSVCGKFSLSGTATSVITDPKYKANLYIISGYVIHQNINGRTPKILSDDIENIIKSDHPTSVLEKIDSLLVWMGKRSTEFGQKIRLVRDKQYPIAYAKSGREFRNIQDAAEEMGYVKGNWADGLSLTVKGYDRLQNLKETNIASKYCFVAISFEAEYDSLFINSIDPALSETGFMPIYLKTKEHNELIDDEIVGGIKRSRFIIAEFSAGNQGVYFESGLAMGLKIPVIRICREDVKEQLHFDIEHYNVIFYKTPDELKEKLIRRIQATIV
jgi:hypothetical protein